jgi:hypothetical protein
MGTNFNLERISKWERIFHVNKFPKGTNLKLEQIYNQNEFLMGTNFQWERIFNRNEFTI